MGTVCLALCQACLFPKDLSSVWNNWRRVLRLELLCCGSTHLCSNVCHTAFSLNCTLQVWRNSWSHLYVSLRGDKDKASIFKTGLQDCLLPPGAAGDHQWGRNGQADVCIPWALQCSQVSAAPPLLHYSPNHWSQFHFTKIKCHVELLGLLSSQLSLTYWALLCYSVLSLLIIIIMHQSCLYLC